MWNVDVSKAGTDFEPNTMGQYYVLLFAIFLVMEEVSNSMAIDTCTSDSDCVNTRFARRHCCRGLWRYSDRKCRSVSSCNRHYCLSNRDCNGPGDLCCVSSACTSVNCPCQNDRNCNLGQYCCLGVTSGENHCSADCLGKYCSNGLSCGSSQECCRSNVCVNCSEPGCRDDYECARGLVCCQKDQGGFCSASCIGATCVNDDDCAGYSECCHDNKCVQCSHLKCKSNSECTIGYCCRGQLHGINSLCLLVGCVGQSCDTTGDCGGPGECCRNKKCAYCSESRCKDSSECPSGEFCCKRNGEAICRKSCVGLYCTSRNDCGAPRECCIENKCTTSGCSCHSNYDCNSGEYCCRGHANYGCNTSCIGATCLSNSDCGAPNEICTYPDRDCIYAYSNKKCPDLPAYKCFNSNGCYSHADCNIFGTGYYCCNEQHNSDRSCNSNCINKFCNADSDCGSSSECCNSKNECQKCSDSFPKWVIGIIVGILLVFGIFVVCLCSKLKKRTMGQQVPTQSTPELVSRQNNPNNQTRHTSNMQRTIDPTLVDDAQSIQLGQISAPYPNSELDYPPSVNSRNLPNQNINASVVPSAPPAEGSIPSRPPPSYRELFGDR